MKYKIVGVGRGWKASEKEQQLAKVIIVIVQRLSLRWTVKHTMFIKHVLILCIDRFVFIRIIAAKGRETVCITGN